MLCECMGLCGISKVGKSVLGVVSKVDVKVTGFELCCVKAVDILPDSGL